MHARAGGESAYPGLWHGLVGGIMPCLTGISDTYDPVSPIFPVTIFQPQYQDFRFSPLGWAWGTNTASPVANNATMYFQSGPIAGKWKVSPPMTFSVMAYWDGAVTIWLFTGCSRTPAFPPSAGTVRGMIFLLNPSSDFPSVHACNSGSLDPFLLSSWVVPVGTPVPLNEWFNLTWVLTAEPISETNTTLYINGLPIEVDDNAGTVVATQPESFTVINGSRATGLDVGSGIWIAGMLVWNRALGAEEVLILAEDIAAPFRRAEMADYGDELIMSFGQIRSPLERPVRKRRRSRVFNAALPIVTVPKIARIIRSQTKRRKRKIKADRGRGVRVLSGQGVNATPALVRRRSMLRTSFNIFGTAEYRAYHSITGPPLETDTPFATAAALPFTPGDLFGNGIHWFSLSYFNGLIDSGFLPVGPNGETALRLDIAGGVETGNPPNGPYAVRLEQRAGGVVRIAASYAQTDALRATEWAIGYTSNGVDPPAGAPTTTKAMGEGALEVLELDIGPFAHGLTIKVRVQARRAGTVYSEDSTVLSTTADAVGPTAPVDSDAIPG
jgi:hypothetical protein